MAEQNDEKQQQQPTPPDTKDQVALELMKFIAVSTGYGKGNQGGAGFGGKVSNRTPEEHADALLQLFERCRSVVKGS